MVIADHAQFEALANEGVVKFVLVELNSSTPESYFQNTEKYFIPHFPYQPCWACRKQQQNYLM